MPTFSFPADLDDPEARPEAVRLMFELGRVVFAAHRLERKAANLWMDLSPEPAVLTPKTGFPPWNELISKLTATVKRSSPANPLSAVSGKRSTRQDEHRSVVTN